MLSSLHSKNVLSEMRRMAPAGRVRTSSALPQVAAKLNLSRLDIDEAIRDLFRAGFLQYQPDGRDLPVSGYITIVPEVVERSNCEIQWEKVLDAVAFPAEAKAALLPLHSKLADLEFKDLTALAVSLESLSKLGSAEINDAGFNVSARNLMGGSKVLSQLALKQLQSLGLPLRLQNASPKYVICAGPECPEATLLIENPRAFENAVRSGLADTVALVCTYGFGLSYLGQEWLQDAATSEYDRPIAIVRAGNPPSLSQLFAMESIYFWADLDLAAFDIFQSLKRAIPQLRLSKIYEAMVPMLDCQNSSHPYAVIFDKDGQRSGGNRSLSFDHSLLALWRLCERRGVDQEAVHGHDIMALGKYPYASDGDVFCDG